MAPFDTLTSIPVGSLVNVASDQERDQRIITLHTLPKSVFSMVCSPQIGAFLRGLTKTHNVDIALSAVMAWAILRIALGEKRLADLAGLLSSEGRVANDKAQAMAREIEKELFAPVMLDLNAFLSSLKQRPAQVTSGATNVLNLKTAPKPISGMNRTAALPVPPKLPRPPQTPPSRLI